MQSHLRRRKKSQYTLQFANSLLQEQSSKASILLCSAFFRRRQWYPTPVLLPGKSHGQRSLVGCSLWGQEESDMTKRLHFHFSPSCIGEGNGNPFQCSCLENPRDGGAWWAAVYGVAQSWTRQKQLSRSISSRLWPARLLCQGGSPGKNTGVYWPILVAIPF